MNLYKLDVSRLLCLVFIFSSYNPVEVVFKEKCNLFKGDVGSCQKKRKYSELGLGHSAKMRLL